MSYSLKSIIVVLGLLTGFTGCASDCLQVKLVYSLNPTYDQSARTHNTEVARKLWKRGMEASENGSTDIELARACKDALSDSLATLAIEDAQKDVSLMVSSQFGSDVWAAVAHVSGCAALKLLEMGRQPQALEARSVRTVFVASASDFFRGRIASELEKLLQDPVPLVRQRAAVTLIDMNIDHAVPKLIQMLRWDPDIDVRKWIAHQLSLGNLKFPFLIPEIEALEKAEKDPVIQKFLAETVWNWKQYQEQMSEKVRKAIRGQNVQVQEAPSEEKPSTETPKSK